MNDKLRFLVMTLILLAFSPVLVPLIWLIGDRRPLDDYVEFYRNTWRR